MSAVSNSSSRIVYDALKASGVRLMSALPETWLVHLIRMAEEDSKTMLVRPAKEEEEEEEEEEEGVGISAGGPSRAAHRRRRRRWRCPPTSQSHCSSTGI